jgi:hypothetical protein
MNTLRYAKVVMLYFIDLFLFLVLQWWNGYESVLQGALNGSGCCLSFKGLVNLHTLDLSDSDIGNSGLRFLTGKSGFYAPYSVPIDLNFSSQLSQGICVDHVCRQIFVE